MLKKVSFLSVALTITVLGNLAFSNPIYFTDRAAFNLAAGGGLNFESFETPFTSAATQHFSDFTFSETDGGGDYVSHTDGFHDLQHDFITSFITDGSEAMWFADNGSSVGQYRFNVSPNINAFGLDITSSEDATLTIGGDLVYSFALSANQSSFFGAIDFVGVFQDITFATSGNPMVGWDALSYGNTETAPVPEPATFILLGSGLAGLAFYRRKKK